MEQTPLHIYKKAFYLHYTEKKPSQAITLYKKLITQFPESDVSVYASMQLAKLKAENVIDEEPSPARNGNPVLTVLIIINLFLTSAAIAGFALYYQNSLKKNERILGLMQAIGKFEAGMHDEAFIILDGIKIMGKDDITPYSIAGDFYCSNHQYTKARKEYETYNRLFPGNSLVTLSMRKINDEELAYKKSLMSQTIPVDTIAGKSADYSQKKQTPRSSQEEPSNTRPRIIKKEDISYF